MSCNGGGTFHCSHVILVISSIVYLITFLLSVHMCVSYIHVCMYLRTNSSKCIWIHTVKADNMTKCQLNMATVALGSAISCLSDVSGKLMIVVNGLGM